jgi:EamA domain-containing membrane protein RarD
MNFSASDRAQFERIRRLEQQWHHTSRWIVLALGVLQVGVAVGGFVWATRRAKELGANLGEYKPVSMFLLAAFGTKVEVLFATGVLTLIYAWRRWRGYPERVLLLSIVAGLGQEGPAGEASGRGV